MAALRGERFHVDLDEDRTDLDARVACDRPDAAQAPEESADPVVPVKDILERSTNGARAPSAPVAKPHSRGFPEHKKRPVSQFKQNKSNRSSEFEDAARYVEQTQAKTTVDKYNNAADPASETASIDAENQQKLASMSAAEIEKEREELLENLSPSLVDRLLSRKVVHRPLGDDDSSSVHPSNKPDGTVTGQHTGNVDNDKSVMKPGKRVQFKEVDPAENPPPTAAALPQTASDKLRVASETDIPYFHFPKPNQPPTLDPSSPSFLTDLHEKYFPSLPADPSKLAWMQDSRGDATYMPNSETIEIPNLRFGFSGSLITPRQAERIAVTEGLHHHEDASSSAGYTIPELARLAHSTVAPQRCIAYQTLGRCMYRLGLGEFGDVDEQIPRGLWKCIQDGHVIETMQAEADRKTGHMSAKTYATEALWLWQKGGGYKLRAE